MKSRVKVSILVPICNVEKYLAECLDSLINQTLKDIEIICLNDGSTDHSLDIIKQYAKKDKRIVIVDKKNTGYGDSMNKGLQKATGEYIGIVESDDFIDTNAFEIMYRVAITNKVEVVKSNFYEYYGESQQDRAISNLFSPEETNKVLDPRFQRNIFYQPPCIWAAIYRNDFIKTNEINFLSTPGASYQDTGFNFKVWASARRVFFVSQAFLHYRQDNINSSVKSSGKIYFVKDEYDSIEKFLKKNKLMDELGSTMFTCRFGAYVWNLRRLTFKAAMKFTKVVADDYHRAKKAGFLEANKLDDVGRANAHLLAIRHPKIYVLLRPLHSLRNFLKTFLSKIVKKIFPRYRQRLQTMDAVARLEAAQADLMSKIASIEKYIRKEKHEE